MGTKKRKNREEKKQLQPEEKTVVDDDDENDTNDDRVDPDDSDNDDAESNDEGEEEMDDDDDDDKEEMDEESEDEDGITRSMRDASNAGNTFVLDSKGEQQSPSSFERCTFDLKNLLSHNNHQVDDTKLYSSTTPMEPEQGDVQSSTHIKKILGCQVVEEDYLMQKSSDACQQLIAAIWNLPRLKANKTGEPLAVLPQRSEMILPRALPPPPPKKQTKWEVFAKQRGITKEQKRSQKVYDEATDTWKFRHGYNKANGSSGAQEWPIMEVKGGPDSDPYADPWELARDAKKTRVEKNLENQMRNQERAGLLPKGTATRFVKHKAKNLEAGRTGGNKDVRRNSSTYATTAAPIPSGVPIDLPKSLDKNNANAGANPLKRGKELTSRALAATQRSTASMGKFDKMIEGEPERKQSVRKQKFDSLTDKTRSRMESEKSMKLLNAVMSGGGAKAKERARRNGSLAKGETAYDYDFDDGGYDGSFKKKKGRAAAGKNKKLTKKRIK
eukprot:CAMPEP_0194395510 /NCGR_PEP_ID=MMETSP0174-20130528/124465_1 /TAXON_ID=216777 /ORGANISM="Proboscia alata, Strain PI-D3" /LENGTH=499 /DNA_ID=CAMNT_0039191457 /DNA_START=39 /DNA_END=1538 /DNA_ORIENTATION=-